MPAEKIWPDRICPVCSSKLSITRHKNEFCSISCEIKDRNKFQKTVLAEAKGTTAWAPCDLDKVMHIVAPSVLILSDIHTPMQSDKWLAAAILAGIKFGTKDVVINGDFLDCNQISKHAGSYYRRGSQLEDDLNAAEAVLKVLFTHFDRVYYDMGNHSMRLVQRFGGELSVQRVYTMLGHFPNLKITARSYCKVNDHVIVMHPRQYSRIRGALAQKLAQRHQCSVLTGHQHHSAMATTPDGKWQACDVGCLVNVELQDYVKNEFNDFPEPMNGFAMIFGNTIQCFDQFTPWEFWGLTSPDKLGENE